MGNRIHHYVRQTQQQNLWCWVAVACSVSECLGHSNDTQCTLASRVLGRPQCCVSPPSCNEMGSLEAGLKAAGCGVQRVPGSAELDAVKLQIDFKQPVCIRVERPDGTTHVMAVVGYDDAEGDECSLQIEDPWTGRDFVQYGLLLSGHARGAWIDTYFTN